MSAVATNEHSTPVLYSARALAEASGATYRQINYWTEHGYLHIVPIEGVDANGSGNRRIYDASEVLVAQCLAALTTDLGAVAEAARKALTVGCARVTPLLVLTHDEGLES